MKSPNQFHIAIWRTILEAPEDEGFIALESGTSLTNFASAMNKTRVELRAQGINEFDHITLRAAGIDEQGLPYRKLKPKSVLINGVPLDFSPTSLADIQPSQPIDGGTIDWTGAIKEMKDTPDE